MHPPQRDRGSPGRDELVHRLAEFIAMSWPFVVLDDQGQLDRIPRGLSAARPLCGPLSVGRRLLRPIDALQLYRLALLAAAAKKAGAVLVWGPVS